MNTHLIPSPITGRLTLLITPDAALADLFQMAACLAAQGPLYILDGGNIFQGYRMARSLSALTGGGAQGSIDCLNNVLLSRAFTCYQMTTFLTETALEAHPVLILDFLATFYDQSVRPVERRRLLTTCLRQLQRLSRATPVGVCVRQRLVIPEDALDFIDLTRRAAAQVWQPRPLAAPQFGQLSLFEEGTRAAA